MFSNAHVGVAGLGGERNHEKLRPGAKAADRSNFGRKEMETAAAYPVRISSRANATRAADCAVAAAAVHLATHKLLRRQPRNRKMVSVTTTRAQHSPTLSL